MAETNFFASRTDGFALIEFLIETCNAEFVPDWSHEPPPFPRFRTAAEVAQHVDRHEFHNRFWIVSPQWERLPMHFHEARPKNSPRYFCVVQQCGGPAFDLIFQQGLSIDGDTTSRTASHFADFAFYLENQEFIKDKSLYREFHRPVRMTEVHREVKKYISRIGRRSICRERGFVGPWILPGALLEYEAGTWLRCGNFHYDPRPTKANRWS